MTTDKVHVPSLNSYVYAWLHRWFIAMDLNPAYTANI